MKIIGTIVFALSAFVLVACGSDSLESRAESAVNKMCGCKDMKCFEAAAKKLEAIGEEVEKKEKSLSKESLAKLETLRDKAEKCEEEAASKMVGTGGDGKGDKGDKGDKGGLTVEDVAQKFSDIADKVCKCGDEDCAMLSMQEFSVVGDAAEKAGLEVEKLADAANKHVERASECMSKL